MYSRDEFYYINYKELDYKFKPYFRKLLEADDMTEKQLNNIDTFDLVMKQINEERVHHIYQKVNAFFMFKDQYDVIKHRYLRRNKNGEVIETPWEMCDRVATFIALAEPKDRTSGMAKLNKWYPIYMNMLLGFRISPNTPTWASAGIPSFGCFACAVSYQDDSMEGISKWYNDTLYMNKYGFGIGHSLHKFRPEGAPFGNSKTKTKSPLKWLNVIQEMAISMQQGDSGRGGANLVSIPIWHPSILEYIGYKNYIDGSDIKYRSLMKKVMNTQLPVSDKELLIDVIDKSIPLKNFNMSVLINDRFMEAVQNDEEWNLNFELPDHSWKKELNARARDIWDKIIDNAFETGDPGLLFFDRINKDNHLKNLKGDIFTTNPCGEQALQEHNICNLWTINLLKHVNFYHGTVNWGQLRDTINVGVRMADNLITQNEYPREVPELEKNEKEQRRIGIDYTGLADTMYLLGIDYGSKESYEFVDKIYRHLRDHTRLYSAILGEKKGSFPLLRNTDLYNKHHEWNSADKCPECGGKIIWHKEEEFLECDKCNWAKYRYLRNLELTTQAPTGTRSRMLGVSFGIEPQFGKWYKSRVMEGEEVYNVNHILDWNIRKWAKSQKIDYKDLISVLDSDPEKLGEDFQSIKGQCEEELFEHWIENYDLTPEQHIEIQATAQKWVSNAISKTINFNEHATKEDLANAYVLAWKKGLKGITIYRKGSHYSEVISKNEKCPECQSDDLLAVEGCQQCRNCGWSKCSI